MACGINKSGLEYHKSSLKKEKMIHTFVTHIIFSYYTMRK